MLFFSNYALSESAAMESEDPGSGLADVDGSARFRWGETLFYGSKGLQYQSETNDTDLWLGLRFQSRFDENPGDIRSPDDIAVDDGSELDIRRARIKGGGDLLWNWLQIYSEYDFPSSALLDLRFTATWQDRVSFRVGQWKSEFNRERVDSSGKQQFVERSIANSWFTIDRQQGVAVSQQFAQGTKADTRVYVEYLSGQGRGETFDNDAGLWLGRIMWSPAGHQLPYSQSSLQRYDSPVPSIAVAFIDGDTPYTRFSSDGGGHLPGFAQGEYSLRLYLFETALQYQGFGWQQEFHMKRIRPRNGGKETSLVGGYAQLGVFADQLWQGAPSALEFVARYAYVDPDVDRERDELSEISVGSNWFFNGHRNKLTADYSWLEGDSMDAQTRGSRFRLQWELSL